MYNLAKSLTTLATNYLSGAFTTNGSNSNQNTIPEFTRDEITEYFSNLEWKSGYMNGKYYGFMPPDDHFAVQLKLISRLIHHRFITHDYKPGELFTPIYLPIDKRVILYKSDLELLDPRNLESPAVTNNPHRDSSQYTWFCDIVNDFDWNTSLKIPDWGTTPIRKIRILRDWYNYQEINLDLPQVPTVKDICAIVYPIIAHSWVIQHKITEYTAHWNISPREPDVLELVFEPGYHIDNARYIKGCYDDVE